MKGQFRVIYESKGELRQVKGKSEKASLREEHKLSLKL